MAKDRPADKAKATAPQAAASQPGRLARLTAPFAGLAGWIRRNPLRGGPALAILAACMIGAGVGQALAFRGSNPQDRERLLAEALKQLDAGDLRQARSLAISSGLIF